MTVTAGAVTVAVSTPATAATVGTGLRKLRGVDLVDGSLEFLARGGEVL